ECRPGRKGRRSDGYDAALRAQLCSVVPYGECNGSRPSIGRISNGRSKALSQPLWPHQDERVQTDALFTDLVGETPSSVDKLEDGVDGGFVRGVRKGLERPFHRKWQRLSGRTPKACCDSGEMGSSCKARVGAGGICDACEGSSCVVHPGNGCASVWCAECVPGAALLIPGIDRLENRRQTCRQLMLERGVLKAFGAFSGFSTVCKIGRGFDGA